MLGVSALPALSRDIPEQCVSFSYRSTYARCHFHWAPGPPGRPSSCMLPHLPRMLSSHSPVAKLFPPLHIPLKPDLRPRVLVICFWGWAMGSPSSQTLFAPDVLHRLSPDTCHMDFQVCLFVFSKNGFSL